MTDLSGVSPVAEAPTPLRRALEVLVITDAKLAAPRSVEGVVDLAVRAGARTVQLRDKAAPPAELLALARRLLALTRPAGALLLINDRADVALAAGADGVHVGPDDLPVSAVRRICPPEFVIGFSTDDPDRARQAEADGASYIGCGAVWPTSSKDVGDEAIGLERLQAVAEAVSIPVVAIGGVDATRAREVRRTGAAGVAVVSAVMSAPDPGAAVLELLHAVRSNERDAAGPTRAATG